MAIYNAKPMAGDRGGHRSRGPEPHARVRTPGVRPYRMRPRGLGLNAPDVRPMRLSPSTAPVPHSRPRRGQAQQPRSGAPEAPGFRAALGQGTLPQAVDRLCYGGALRLPGAELRAGAALAAFNKVSDTSVERSSVARRTCVRFAKSALRKAAKQAGTRRGIASKPGAVIFLRLRASAWCGNWADRPPRRDHQARESRGDQPQGRPYTTGAPPLTTCLKPLTVLAEAGTGIAAPLMLGDEPAADGSPSRCAWAACPARGTSMDDAGEGRADG
jgi:hypothetical protein